LVYGIGAPRALAESPPSIEEQTKRATALLQARQIQAAIQAFEAALKVNARYMPALEGLANAYFAGGMYGEAIDQYREALRVNPGYLLGYYNIAYSLRKSGRHLDAIRSYREYLQKQPDDPDAYFGLAECYKVTGDIPNAIANYARYVEREKRPSEAAWVAKARQEIAALEASLQAPVAPSPPQVSPAPSPPSRPAPSPSPDATGGSALRPAPPAPAPPPPPPPARRILGDDALRAREQEVARLKAEAEAEKKRHSVKEAAERALEAKRREAVETEARRARQEEAARRSAEEERRSKAAEAERGRDPAEAARIAADIAERRKIAAAESARRAVAEEEARRILQRAASRAPSTFVPPARNVPLQPAKRLGSHEPEGLPIPGEEPELAPLDRSAIPPAAARVSSAAPTTPPPDPQTQALLREGEGHFRAGDYSRALKSYRLAAARAPRSPDILYKVGVTHLMLHDYVQAARAFEQVLAIAGNHAGARQNLDLSRKKLTE
jgi:tetratricopeptide (TPR) repeat protein